MPSRFCRGALAEELHPQVSAGKVLVVIQMSGGNDGINTVEPFADEYRLPRRLSGGIDPLAWRQSGPREADFAAVDEAFCGADLLAA